MRAGWIACLLQTNFPLLLPLPIPWILPRDLNGSRSSHEMQGEISKTVILRLSQTQKISRKWKLRNIYDDDKVNLRAKPEPKSFSLYYSYYLSWVPRDITINAPSCDAAGYQALVQSTIMNGKQVKSLAARFIQCLSLNPSTLRVNFSLCSAPCVLCFDIMWELGLLDLWSTMGDLGQVHENHPEFQILFLKFRSSFWTSDRIPGLQIIVIDVWPTQK